MIIPENLSKYVIDIDPYMVKWQDMELNLRDMRMLSNLTDNQLDEIEIHGLFKDDKVRTCRFIPTRSTPLTISEVVALVTGNFPEHKNKRHNRKTDYKINWDVVEKRKLLHDFSIGALSAVPLEKVDQLPKFHKHFPVHLIQRLSEMSDTQYNNIFERKLIWNPYLNTERFGHDWVKNKEFVHNPEKINIHKSCFGYDKKTKRTERFKESALGYDFWNQIFWLARLSPENWRKVEQYNLLMFSASDMATYMNLSDGTLQKVSDKAMFRHVHYAFKKNIWNVTFRIDILDDMAARKYGKIYKDISHYKKAPELITKVNGLTMGWGSNSDDAVKKELGVNFIPKDECFKIIASFGINWTEAMPELSLTKQYRKIAASYHPDLASKDKQDEYKEKFGTLALAVNTLKKYIEIQNKQKR